MKDFLRNRIFFSEFPLNVSPALQKIQEEEWNDALDIIEKNCLSCVDMHRELYDAKTNRIRGLGRDSGWLGHLNLLSFNQRMGHDKSIVEPMIHDATGKVQMELYDIVRKAYGNPSFSSSVSNDFESQYLRMKKRLFE